MFAKLGLYANTVKSMKLTQVYYRIRKMLKLDCSIGCKITSDVSQVAPITTVDELDYDPTFLRRFPADELFNDTVTFLHSSKEFHWDEKWHFDDKPTLWNFNLHYFEFLFSLVDAYRKTGDRKYLDKSIEIIRCWIAQNPQANGGEGWSSYTIDLRLSNWLGYYTAVHTEFDDNFQSLFINSVHEQYEFLSRHLEKDILGNHYFEDLKTLVLCALFFNDEPVLHYALKAFKAECKEEILPDGMHFELSPMYHKLIFEGVVKVAVALKDRNLDDCEVKGYLQPMLDAAWSLEEGLDRIPLFNDAGNNVAKSLHALVSACKTHFDIVPEYKSRFVDSGFYIFKQNDWKLIVDAGQPGPSYIPGHAHCDAMSFELFKCGKPVIVNCGTYAYQCKERSFFRSTAAHNTVMVNDTEQSECWGAFRMAKRSSVCLTQIKDNLISIIMTDQRKNLIRRTIEIGDERLKVTDISKGNSIKSFLHVDCDSIRIFTDASVNVSEMPYAEEYGIKKIVRTHIFSGADCVAYIIEFEERAEHEN